MTKTKLRGALALAASLLAAGLLAACGSNSGSSASAAAATPPSGGGSGDTISVAGTGLGQILVDSSGKTLYMFEKDPSANASACSGDCASEWPPLTANGKPTGGGGIDASKLTTFKRDDGATQVAFNGHPLYTFTADSAPGDTNGNGLDDFGGVWHAVTSAGGPAAGASSSGSSGSGSDTSSSSSSGGYSY